MKDLDAQRAALERAESMFEARLTDPDLQRNAEEIRQSDDPLFAGLLDMMERMDWLYAHHLTNRRSILELHEKVEDLEHRLSEVQTLKYVGTWREGQQHQAGDAVTHDGSLWIALRETITRPGEQRSGWQLAVKRGKDGKDRR